MNKKHQKGFTLVELLIVVAIIGILAAIAIPNFTKYKKNAAIGNAKSALANCVSELQASYTESSTVTTKSCVVDTGTITMSLDTSTGQVSLPAAAVSVKGISFSCSIAGTPAIVDCQ